MTRELSSLESDLQRLRPAAIDDALLTRIEACTTGCWTELNAAETDFEQLLRERTPIALPPALMATLEQIVSAVPFPGQENIIRFPDQSAPPHRSHRAWWGAAAAAVAIFGALVGLLMPHQQDSPSLTHAAPIPTHTRSIPATGELIPASFKRGLSETRDEGVIWQTNEQPHRVLKVVYVDRATLKDAQGRTYQVEQPRVEYLLVPAQTD